MTEVYNGKEVDRGRPPSHTLSYKANTLYYQCPSTQCRHNAPLKYVTRTLHIFGKEVEQELIANGDITQHHFILSVRIDPTTTLSIWRCDKCGALDYREEA